MALVPLEIGAFDQLRVNLELSCRIGGNIKRYRRPVPFVVDTGAERTFIVPYWERRISGALSLDELPTASGNDTLPSQTLLGTLQFKVTQGVELKARTCTGTLVPLSTSRYACVACVKTLQWVKRRHLNNIHVNILGRDILADWTLYHNPDYRNPTNKRISAAFLCRRQYAIDSDLKQHPSFKPYYDQLDAPAPSIAEMPPNDG